MVRALPWLVRFAWLSLPFTAGPAISAALDDRSAAVRSTASAGMWALWGIVFCATLVLHPLSLTLLRVVAPAAVGASIYAMTREVDTVTAVGGLVATALAAGLAFLPETGVLFVNGSAYPNERRFLLRPPGPLLAGPLLAAWLLTVGGIVGGVLLLAAKQWIAGAIILPIGAAATAILGRAMHGLARRWIVFVPAGVVLHDPMTLADPVLFRRQTVRGFDLAAAGTDAVDLTQRAPGLAIEIDLTEEVPLALMKVGQRIGPTVWARRLLFTPTRPGRVLHEARQRAMPAPTTRSPS
jgi:hypothetical protein